jgi:hypothetical protein
MVRLKIFICIAFLITLMPFNYGRAIHQGPLILNWITNELIITGTGRIHRGGPGNIMEWQYEATLRAQADLEKQFILAMSILRKDAFESAQDRLLAESEKNAMIYEYIRNVKKPTIVYTDEDVIIRENFPLFGERGLAQLLVSAGTNIGDFPVYKEYTFSAPFTGLVIDARGLNRLPALGPKIFDENHIVIYSVDQVHEKSFKKWGAVQYTKDPYYRGFEERVGENPFRIVAIQNDKLIETDMGISNEDARILLQNEISKQSLEEGRVIIIIDSLDNSL